MKRKVSLFFAALLVLFSFGCNDIVEEGNVHVSSFEEMGCSSSFGDIVLSRYTGGTDPLESVRQLNCNSATSVRIEFYDFSSTTAGHYKYFLVNNKNTYLDDYISAWGTGTYTFMADPLYYNVQGSFYASYRVTATNLETGQYTYRDYGITAYDNYYAKEPAQAAGEYKKLPEILVMPDDNKSETKTDNATLDNAAAEEVK